MDKTSSNINRFFSNQGRKSESPPKDTARRAELGEIIKTGNERLEATRPPRESKNTPWSPRNRSTQAEAGINPNPKMLQSYRSPHSVDLEDESSSSELDISEKVPTTMARPAEGASEKSPPFSEKESSLSIATSDQKTGKTRLTGLAELRRPKFGSLHSFKDKTRSLKMPTLIPRNKTKSEKKSHREPLSPHGMYPEVINAPISVDFPVALEEAIKVTMDNVLEVIDDIAKVIDDTASVPGIRPGRRVMNLIYCGAGGRDVVNRPELCPETGAFAQSLIELPEETRLAWVNGLIKKFQDQILPMQMNRLNGKGLDDIKRACAAILADQS